VNLSEQERYLKPIATGGSSGGGLASVTCILLRGRHNPPTQDNTVVQVGF
jgi:acetyl esterase/lipase